MTLNFIAARICLPRNFTGGVAVQYVMGVTWIRPKARVEIRTHSRPNNTEAGILAACRPQPSIRDEPLAFQPNRNIPEVTVVTSMPISRMVPPGE